MHPFKFLLGLFCVFSIIFLACKTKPTKNEMVAVEINVLAELKEGVAPKRLKEDLKTFSIKNMKRSNRTLNQYVFKAKSQERTSEEILKSINDLEYVVSAIIAPLGAGSAENMQTGKVKKTKPIRD